MIAYLIAMLLGMAIGLLASTGVAMILWIATVLSGSAAEDEQPIEDEDSE